MAEHLWDVIAVDMKSKGERFMDRGKTRLNADAIVTMAVMRRGVEEEFFKVVPSPHTLRSAITEDGNGR